MFWQQFEGLCTKVGKAPNAVAKELSIPSGSITAWSKGVTPRNTTLKKIADYFGVSIDYLTGSTVKNEKPATVPGDELSENKRYLLESVPNLSEAQAKMLRAVIEQVLEETAQ